MSYLKKNSYSGPDLSKCPVDIKLPITLHRLATYWPLIYPWCRRHNWAVVGKITGEKFISLTLHRISCLSPNRSDTLPGVYIIQNTAVEERVAAGEKIKKIRYREKNKKRGWEKVENYIKKGGKCLKIAKPLVKTLKYNTGRNGYQRRDDRNSHSDH